ncbi:XdhC family protein [Alloacidobacterium dinghuense]|uniref:XdhC family protein n=1 Tax=Alloacidobacterium dinghuense TaxID=2763107 RepID=A0A7G8BHN7_9BACT|nr:XdhC/CoxI family protein [Alloacidobacterium dinghuense]QNI32057.1 XdhC family protein [Alloacidobacterium dinghuense]
MSELQQIVALWRAAKARQEEVCLATVVRVEGSSYRKPGARMLLTQDGQRAGTISGGCLEAEVAKKAWWLTRNGSTIQRYSSFFDDDSPAPYGLGCGGTVHVHLDRSNAAHAVLNALDANLNKRIPFVIVTDTDRAKTVLVQQIGGETLFVSPAEPSLAGITSLAQRAASERRSFYAVLPSASGHTSELFVEYVAPSPALTIFGAGDDAKPLADFAKRLGWYITIADGRSHLASAARFPQVDRVIVLDFEATSPLRELSVSADDAFVLLTHSYEQDRAILRQVLPYRPKYLGMLGPRQRTERLVGEIASLIGISSAECMAALHAPVGFDIGAHTPESIALSIIAEIVAVINGREGTSLKKQARKHIHPTLNYV